MGGKAKASLQKKYSCIAFLGISSAFVSMVSIAALRSSGAALTQKSYSIFEAALSLSSRRRPPAMARSMATTMAVMMTFRAYEFHPSLPMNNSSKSTGISRFATSLKIPTIGSYSVSSYKIQIDTIWCTAISAVPNPFLMYISLIFKSSLYPIGLMFPPSL